MTPDELLSRSLALGRRVHADRAAVSALAAQRQATGLEARRVVAYVKRIQDDVQRALEARQGPSDLRRPRRDPP